MKQTEKWATLLAPLAPAALFLLFILMFAQDSVAKILLNPFTYLIIPIMIACSYFGFFIVGLPATIILKRYSALTLVNLILVAGFFGGVLGLFIFTLLFGSINTNANSYLHGNVIRFLLGAACGSLVALIYGIVAKIPILKREKK